MKKILSMVLMLAICLSAASTATAFESGDPCLLYGYDPDTRDDYETYGDEVFFRDKKELDSPIRPIIVILNRYAAENIIRASESKGTTEDILNASYFPELEIVHVQCNYNYEDYFNDYKYRYLEDNEYDSEFMVKIYLKHWSKKNYRDAIIKLSPRVDVDIEDIQIVSYSLNDVSKILKCVAGWEGYTYHDLIVETAETGTVFDLAYDDKITLADASMILKIIAGWDIATF